VRFVSTEPHATVRWQAAAEAGEEPAAEAAATDGGAAVAVAAAADGTSLEAQKKKRAERFGIAVVEVKAAPSGGKPGTMDDKLKSRAARCVRCASAERLEAAPTTADWTTRQPFCVPLRSAALLSLT
jgi:hypothetical protein